jgi:NodT family efflux transporter outer membrane factor (OMF) lipoprotein
LRQQASVARDALAVLIGRTAGEAVMPTLDLSRLVLPEQLPLALPSELVRQRPDIAAAEAQLHAASAAIGVATAQLYPSVTLTAGWTVQGSSGAALLGGGSSLWSLAAGLLAPIFSGGTLEAQRDAAVDAYAAELAIYRQTVLQAFGTVADVLQSLEHAGAAVQAQRTALDTAQTVLDLTQQAYEAGQVTFLQILVAQRLYQQARQGYVAAKAQRYVDTAQFFIAMGGAHGLGRATP